MRATGNFLDQLEIFFWSLRTVLAKNTSHENPYDQLEAVWVNWKFFRPTGNISSSFRSALVKIKFRYLNRFQYSGSLYLDFETDINT